MSCFPSQQLTERKQRFIVGLRERDIYIYTWRWEATSFTFKTAAKEFFYHQYFYTIPLSTQSPKQNLRNTVWEIQILCHFMQAIFRTIRGLNWRFSDFMLRTTRNILRIQSVCLFLLFKMKFRVKPTNRSTTVMSPSVDSLFKRNTTLLEIISGP